MKKQLGVFVCLLSWACGDGVGTDQCVGANVRCEAPRDLDEVSIQLKARRTSDLPPISPTWVHELSEQSTEYGSVYSTLISDFEGDLWLFSAQGDELLASTLDSDGQTTGSQSIKSPRDGKFRVDMLPPRQSVDGPTIPVSWRLQPGRSIEDIHTETLKFGKHIDDPVQRVPQEYGGELYQKDLVWARDGSIYSGSAGVVEKRDRKLDLVWRQSALKPQNAHAPHLNIGLLQDDRVVVLTKSETFGTWTAVIGSNGNYEHAITNLDMDISWPLLQGPRGPVIVASDLMGDLLVATIASNPMAYNGARFLREHFADLGDATRTTVDPAGNAYVSMNVGGRELTERRRALCRVLTEGEPGCFELTGAPELELSPDSQSNPGLAVNADGVVFIMIANSLMRFDLPN